MENEASGSSQLKVGVVFSIGLPRKHGGRIFDREGHLINLPGASGDLLENCHQLPLDVSILSAEECQTLHDHRR